MFELHIGAIAMKVLIEMSENEEDVFHHLMQILLP